MPFQIFHPVEPPGTDILWLRQDGSARAFDGDQGLNRVNGRIEISLPGRCPSGHRTLE